MNGWWSQYSGSFGLLEQPICRGFGLRFCSLRSSARRSGQHLTQEIPFILPIHAQSLPPEILNGLFLLTPNQTEAGLLTGIEVQCQETATAAAEILLEQGVENVAITLGSGGVLLASKSGSELIAAPEVSAVESTAAGDCFNGACAVTLARGLSLNEAVRYACQAAAVSVTRMGAQDSLPRANEVQLP